jgi:probable F420-dependent oxidoreductase
VTASLRIGAKLPHSGELAMRRGPAEMAAVLEKAGFDSVWVSDHVVFPHQTKSRYPFAADGKVTWRLDDPYFEPMVVLGAVTATTTRVTIGTTVVIAPMRNPVLLAKQAACIDVMSGGRLVLGVGVGWLREEFEALGADYEHRGAVLDEWIGIARESWSGSIGPHKGAHYQIPTAMHTLPKPAGALPVLVGGMSRHALRRAGALADGWLGQYALDTMSERDVKASADVMRHEAEEAGRSQKQVDGLRVVLRITGAAAKPDTLAARLPRLAEAGVSDVIVDVDWTDPDGPARSFEKLNG